MRTGFERETDAQIDERLAVIELRYEADRVAREYRPYAALWSCGGGGGGAGRSPRWSCRRPRR